jgi:hypothetical protein
VAREELRGWPTREGLAANGGARRSACCQHGGDRGATAELEVASVVEALGRHRATVMAWLQKP